MTVDRSRFTDNEWSLKQAGKCCYQTAYGLPWSEWCSQPSAPGNPFGYCAEHAIEEDTMPDSHDEHAAISDVLRIRDEQGWDEDTLLGLYEAFVAKAGLTPVFARYVAGVQVKENRSSPELDRMLVEDEDPMLRSTADNSIVGIYDDDHQE